MKRILFFAALLAFPLFASAQSASPWIITGSGNHFLKPVTNQLGLQVPGLATSTTGCLSVNSTGWISANGSACGSGGSSASSTLLGDTNLFSGTDLFSNTIKVAALSGLIGGNSGTLYGFASSSLFGYTPLNPTRNINTTYPVQGGGDLSADRTLTVAATSTWFGSPTPGQILAFLSGQNQYVSTSTLNIGGNAGTATALAANGTNCTAQAAVGVDASGNAEGCFTVPTFAYPFISSATSSLLSFTGGILVTSSSTFIGNATTTGTHFAGIASSTSLYGANLTPCTGTNALTWTGGLFTCTAQPQGTVTTASVVSANGFAGSVANAATAPAITLTTSITGLLKGNGTAISAAALTDFPTIALNTVLANGTSGTAAPTAIATSSFFGASTPGFVLANTSAGLALVASTTYSAGAGIGLGFANNTLTITNTGAAFAFPFTPTVNFGVNTNATGTIMNFTAGIQASSTSNIFAAKIGSTSPQAYANTPLIVTGNVNNSVQNVLQNVNASSASSADFIVGTDLMTDSIYYGDLGYNSSTNNAAAYTGFAANALYLYNNDGEVDFAAASSTNTGAILKFFTGGTVTANERARFTSTGLFGIGSTTPFSRLSIGTGAASSSITVAEYKYGITGNVATSTTANIDCNASTQIAWPMGTGAATLTLINLTPGKTCRVFVQNPNAAAGAITWAVPLGFVLHWIGGGAGNTAPTQTTTANFGDMWSFAASAGSSTIQVLGAQSVW